MSSDSGEGAPTKKSSNDELAGDDTTSLVEGLIQRAFQSHIADMRSELSILKVAIEETMGHVGEALGELDSHSTNIFEALQEGMSDISKLEHQLESQLCTILQAMQESKSDESTQEPKSLRKQFRGAASTWVQNLQYSPSAMGRTNTGP